MDRKLKILDQLYHLYNECMARFSHPVCYKGCAVCCTRNVTATTLEGLAIIRYLSAENRMDTIRGVRAAASFKRFIPALTTNRIAELCLEEKSWPEEELDPAWGPCPLLRENLCVIYPVRPFACRCMLSDMDCTKSGHAQVDDFVLTINTVFLQIIEQLDVGGKYGNLIDILLFLVEDSAPLKRDAEKWIVNIPIPALMIPPEQRQAIQPILDAVRALHDA